jgi:predicted transglutaminase-like cysteine proteinase
MAREACVPDFKKLLAILALSGLSACASESLSAIPAAEPAHATLFRSNFSPAAALAAARGGPAKPPSGYIAFCARFPNQCAAQDGAPRQLRMTDEVWNTLEEVNAAFNKSIVAEDDRVHYGTEEYWTIPTDGHGDCEDYVVAKRQALLKLGLPAPALRIAVVFAPHFVRHAVLTVATDSGNYVLDNLRDDIMSWDKTGYVFIERQDPGSASGWVSVE